MAAKYSQLGSAIFETKRVMTRSQKQPQGEKPVVQVITLDGPLPPLDREFKPNELSAVFSDVGLSFGRCFGSKSGYCRMNPGHTFVPNANVFCQRHGKVWWGDLDLQCDKPALEKAARRLGCRLYVLMEMDGRFENAEQPHSEVVGRALWHTGGTAYVPGVRRIQENSGLSLVQLAYVTRIKPARLTSRQRPEIALEIHRRLRQWDETFGEVAIELGLKKWGTWWTTAHDKLGGKSPLAVLRNGGTIRFAEVLDPVLAFRCGIGLPWIQKRI